MDNGTIWFQMGLKSEGDVSTLEYSTILGHECIVIVYLSDILSW